MFSCSTYRFGLVCYEKMPGISLVRTYFPKFSKKCMFGDVSPVEMPSLLLTLLLLLLLLLMGHIW